MHVTTLLCIWPTTYHEYSSSQLVFGKQPNISHLWIFGCAVYVPIAPTQHIKMGLQWQLVIYVGFDSPSIIRYLEPLTDGVFTAWFANYHFNKSVFLSLGGGESRFLKNDEKLLGRHLLWLILILIQINVN